MTTIAEHIAKMTPGAGLKDFEHQIDMASMRRCRLARARAQIERRDLAACLPYDMANIGYASGTNSRPMAWLRRT